MSEIIDLIGQVFGRLTVIERVPVPSWSASNRAWWRCRCACDNVMIIDGKRLRNGHTLSCGCLHKELLSQRSKTHGETMSTEYASWCSAKDRCFNQKAEKYPIYGARGITMCERWRHDFPAFLRDMGRKPSSAHTLDRINNDGNYSPENCRWATVEQQQNNRRVSVYVSYQGRRQTVSQWARELNLDPTKIFNRMRCGWSFERAIKTPCPPRRRSHTT